MKRRDVLIFIKGFGLVAIADLFKGCGTSIVGPDDVKKVWKGEVEFMYERVLPITNPTVPDPNNLGFASIYNFALGGKNSSKWQLVEEGKWIASAYLCSHPQEYYVGLWDLMVSNDAIAKKLSGRIKGDIDWIELTCIVPNPIGAGEKTKMILTSDGQIQIPPK